MRRSGSLWLLYCAVCYSAGLRGHLGKEAHRIYPRPDRSIREDDLATTSSSATSGTSASDRERVSSPSSLAATSGHHESASIPDFSLYHLEDYEYYIVATEAGAGLDKRQTGGSFTYMSSNGSVSNDCTTAPVYKIFNGALSGISNGATYQEERSSSEPVHGPEGACYANKLHDIEDSEHDELHTEV